MKRLLTICTLLLSLFTIGCGRVVPAGNTVLILKANGSDVIRNSGSYFAYGRDVVYFVNNNLKSYSKDIKILCSDNINMDVRFKWLGSFNVTDKTIPIIRSKITATKLNGKNYQLSLDNFYRVAMEDLISSIVRTKISQYKTDNIGDNREKIRLAIKKAVVLRLKELNYPVETADFLITNLDYPVEVTRTRKDIKNAELQDLKNAAIAKAEVSKAKRDAEIAAEKGKAQLVRAEADAAANRVRTSSLTPEIIMVKQIEMYEQLANGPNNTSVLIPFNALGNDIQNTMLLKTSLDKPKKDTTTIVVK